jgi:hypothetical protein
MAMSGAADGLSSSLRSFLCVPLLCVPQLRAPFCARSQDFGKRLLMGAVTVCSSEQEQQDCQTPPATFWRVKLLLFQAFAPSSPSCQLGANENGGFPDKLCTFLSRMSDLHFPTVCVSDLLLKSISLRHFL